jgi:hypothetical protein
MEHLDVNQRLKCLSAGLQSVDTTDDTRPLSPKGTQVKTSASNEQNGLSNKDWKTVRIGRDEESKKW